MIVVVSVGRAGTSLVMRWLQACGLDVGSTKWFKPVNAGLENRNTVDINNRLFRYFVKGEDINLHHVRGDIADLPFDAVKDTQFLTHPGIIKEWLNTRDDLQIVWMRRDPAKIVESVYKIPEWNTPVYRTDAEMIKKKESEFEEAIAGTDYQVYHFPDILTNIEPFIENCQYELPDDAAEKWYKMVDNKEH